jgi:hypothetical protein
MNTTEHRHNAATEPAAARTVVKFGRTNLAVPVPCGRRRSLGAQ